MVDEIELELTYLAKRLPDGLEKHKHKEVLDIYLPKSAAHPTLRLRKSGDRFMITKKEPVNGSDSSHMLEQTIPLTAIEFGELSQLEGKRLRKIRYSYDYKGAKIEVDIFQDALKGLVLIDFEFNDPQAKAAFIAPDFCLAEVKQEAFIAGGMLCGKNYSDIEAQLCAFKYKKL